LQTRETTSATFTLPSADGTANQVLQTNGSGVLSFAGVSAAAGQVIQVVSSTQTSTFTTSSQNVYVTTGQTLSITPGSTSNKILVMFSANSITTLGSNTAMYVQVRRSGNVICAGIYYTATVTGNQTVPFGVIQNIDSPSTTSSVTYEVFAQESGIAGTVSLNGDRVLTLLEVKG
jgi:hypothetical protein